MVEIASNRELGIREICATDGTTNATVAITAVKSNRRIPKKDTSTLFIAIEFIRFSILSPMNAIKPVNLWTSPEHARDYLERADQISHRSEGESVLLEFVARGARKILDLGTGDGRLLAIVLRVRPDANAVALDFSPAMLDSARKRFESDSRVEVIAHNLDSPLPNLGRFDAVVSSFAIHHVTHERKRELYSEVYRSLNAGGTFCNLEHVSSPSARLHGEFLSSIGFSVETEDPSNKLLDVEAQLVWLREIGFKDVDCHWKWRELALLAGVKA
jgi:tRNA (cmo5U34)-methyltransferase